MKSLLTLLITIAAFSSYADTYRLKDSLCGEIDPFIIGDACVLVFESKQKEIVLISNEDFMESVADRALISGDLYDINFTGLDLINQSTTRSMRTAIGRSLNIRPKAQFFYLDDNSGVNKIELTNQPVEINCKAEGSSNSGYLDANIDFSAKLLGTGDFTKLEDIKFSYELLDGSDIWSSGATTIEYLLNYIRYRPQVYTSHQKFSFWLSERNNFGEFDIILPITAIRAGQTTFTGHIIMTAIDDHYGDSVSMECYLK